MIQFVQEVYKYNRDSSEDVFIIGDHLSLVFMASFLAVAGSDGGPSGAGAGVIDGINDRLSPG